MPLYEYYCADCRSKFELLVSYAASEADDLVCAKCQGGHVRKLLSVFAAPRGGSDGYEASGGDDFGGSGGGCCGGACGCHD